MRLVVCRSRARLDYRESEKVLNEEFRLLVEQHGARVLNVALRNLRDADKTQDCRFLFHRACSLCEITPLVLTAYESAYESLERC